MKKGERRILVLAAVVVVVVTAQILFTAVTARRRDERLAKIKRPDSIVAYERLAAEPSGKETDSPARQTDRKVSVFPDNATDTFAAYERLQAHVLSELNGEVLPEVADKILSAESDKITDEERAAIREALRERENLVQQLRELAARGGPIFPLDFTQGMRIELPHLSRTRYFARLLTIDAIVNAADGDYARAVDDIIAGMQLGDALAQEPILISQIHRTIVYGIMIEGITQSFHGSDLSAEQMSRLQAHLDQADNRHAFAESYLGEQTLMSQTLTQIRDGEHTDDLTRNIPLFKDTTTMGQLTKPFRPLLKRSFVHVMAPRLNMLESGAADLMSRSAAAAEQPYYQARPELMRIDQEAGTLARSHWITDGQAPSALRACEAQARHEAKIDLTQIGLVIEQYQADNGSYPATLDAVAPRLGGSAPIDPFTGEQYHYRRTDDTFHLYSVGANSKDDGGIHDYKDGDILWRGR